VSTWTPSWSPRRSGLTQARDESSTDHVLLAAHRSARRQFLRSPGTHVRTGHEAYAAWTNWVGAHRLLIDWCYDGRRNDEFVRFRCTVDTQVPKKLHIHIIVDNYGTHTHQNLSVLLLACRWCLRIRGRGK
jgi:hypothetical protein